jgi:hypothetical protein
VVWQGRAGDRSPYADFGETLAAAGTRIDTDKSHRKKKGQHVVEESTTKERIQLNQKRFYS